MNVLKDVVDLFDFLTFKAIRSTYAECIQMYYYVVLK